jgi:uncharacterized protein (UPF0332 family)
LKELDELINKAERFLRSAEILFNDGDYDSCVSRCYYAMFLMAEAVLLTKGLKTHSHKGVISLFGKHFIKTGVFKKDLGKVLNEAYDTRLIGDYAIGLKLSKEEAKNMLESAKNFVNELTLPRLKHVGFFLHRLDISPNSRSFTSRVPHGRAV